MYVWFMIYYCGSSEDLMTSFNTRLLVRTTRQRHNTTPRAYKWYLAPKYGKEDMILNQRRLIENIIQTNEHSVTTVQNTGVVIA